MRLLLPILAVISLAAFAAPAAAEAPVILRVEVDDPGARMQIFGTGFGAAEPSVTLEGIPLVVVTHTATDIVVGLPLGGNVPGTYLLRVTQGTPTGPFGGRGHDQFNVTIGAEGPQGIQGVPGPPGPQGATGPQGAQGPTGPVGATGATGAQGPQGATGAQGPTGAPGAQGAPGPTGPPGAIGPTGATGPQGPAGTTGQAAVTLLGTGTINPGAAFVIIPNLTTTINVPANAMVLVSTDGGIQTTSAVTTGVSRVDIALQVDGALLPSGSYRRVIAQNTGGSTTTIENYAMATSLALPAGNHTIAVVAALQSGSAANVGGNSASVLQGQLTVTILKQ